MLKKSIRNNIILWRLTLDTNNNFHIIAEFEFFIENTKVWLNECFVTEELRRKGIAEFIIIKAIEEFDEIYFSSADKGEHRRRNIENDKRYIEPPDGENFVKALLVKKIIKQEWYKNPFNKDSYSII